MPFIPVPQVVQVELIFNHSGEICENVIHYTSPVEPTTASMSLLGQQIVDWYAVNAKDQFPSTTQLQNVKLTDLTTQNSEVVNYAVSLPMVGTRVGAALPNNVALTITKRTARRGRSYRGRLYHMGLTEADVTGNTVTPAVVTSIVNDYLLLLTRTTADGGYTMVVVSRQLNNVVREVGVVEPVTGMTSDGVVDSQRRRLPGRGT